MTYLRFQPNNLGLSTGAGAAYQLRESLQVEPENRKALVEAYETALTMKLDERQKRHAESRRIVENKDLK